MNTILVQLTDTHVCQRGAVLYGRIDTGAMLHSAVTSVLELKQKPDAVVVTGDLVDVASPAEYAQVEKLLAPLDMPVYLMPGNHDERDQMRKGFPSHVYLGTGEFIQYTVKIGNLRLITLDTLVPGQPHGELCDTRMAWLAQQLEACRDETVILAMHHPPFQTLIGHMDNMGLIRGGPELEKLISSYPNVARIICGHLHRAIDVRFGGTIASTSPSTAHQVAPDFAADAPAMWNFEPAGFRIHVCTDAGQVVTHLVHSGEYPGPYPFE